MAEEDGAAKMPAGFLASDAMITTIIEQIDVALAVVNKAVKESTRSIRPART